MQYYTFYYSESDGRGQIDSHANILQKLSVQANTIKNQTKRTLKQDTCRSSVKMIDRGPTCGKFGTSIFFGYLGTFSFIA